VSLTKIAELKLNGKELDLAKNGEHHHLVSNEPDAYGEMRATRISLNDIAKTLNVASSELVLQLLLDVLGSAHAALRASRDMHHRPE
jgi:hypothetical protein